VALVLPRFFTFFHFKAVPALFLFGSGTDRTEFINFSERDLTNDDSSFCSLILSATDLHCHVFAFEKLLLNVCLCL